MTVEDRVVLEREEIERHADREGDHDGVDAGGADGEEAGSDREQGGDRDCDRARTMNHGQSSPMPSELCPKIAIM